MTDVTMNREVLLSALKEMFELSRDVAKSPVANKSASKQEMVAEEQAQRLNHIMDRLIDATPQIEWLDVEARIFADAEAA